MDFLGKNLKTLVWSPRSILEGRGLMDFLEALGKFIVGSLLLSLIMGAIYGAIQGFMYAVENFGTGVVHLAWVPVFGFMAYLIGSVYSDHQKKKKRYSGPYNRQERRKKNKVA